MQILPDPPAMNPYFRESTAEGGAVDPEMLSRLQRLGIGEDLGLSSNWSAEPSSNYQSALNSRVLGNKRVIFSARAIMGDPNRDQVYRYRVEQAGGIYISGLCLGGNGVPREILESADIFITSHRDNEEYIQAIKCNIIIGTPDWILRISSTGVWSVPGEHLLHYPYPWQLALGFEDQTITLTNYYGDARNCLKKLITALGAKHSPHLTDATTCVIAAHTIIPPDRPIYNKIHKAREHGIPIVNHLWLEDSFREWTKLPMSDPKYLNFPHGHNWMDELNTGTL